MKRVCLAKDYDPGARRFRYWCGRLCPREDKPNTVGIATTCDGCRVAVRKATGRKEVVDLQTEL